jgi:hypothetical protein
MRNGRWEIGFELGLVALKWKERREGFLCAVKQGFEGGLRGVDKM